VLVDGEPLIYLERGGRSVVTLPAFDGEQAPLAIAALSGIARDATGRGLNIERIDGEPAADSPHAAAFRAAGFATGYRGLTYRAPREALAGARGG
jgi:ATP-dependent helicase Lhr and Lhr-like helicase